MIDVHGVQHLVDEMDRAGDKLVILDFYAPWYVQIWFGLTDGLSGLAHKKRPAHHAEIIGACSHLCAGAMLVEPCTPRYVFCSQQAFNC